MSTNLEHSEPAISHVTLRQAQQEFVITGATARFSVYDHEANTVTIMSSLNTYRTPPELEQDFYALADRWRSETAFISLASEQANNFNYHQIIGMGKPVLPLIFRELRETTSDWFWALRAITRTDVQIAAEDRGNVDKVAEAWLEWGKDHGYLTS
jgi:hypothetical protein